MTPILAPVVTVVTEAETLLNSLPDEGVSRLTLVSIACECVRAVIAADAPAEHPAATRLLDALAQWVGQGGKAADYHLSVYAPHMDCYLTYYSLHTAYERESWVAGTACAAAAIAGTDWAPAGDVVRFAAEVLGREQADKVCGEIIRRHLT